MRIWVITENCCGEYVAAFKSQESAEKECKEMNEWHNKNFGRFNYSVDEDELED